MGVCFLSHPQEPASEQSVQQHSFETLLAMEPDSRLQHEVMEVFGGIGLTMRILIRRHVVGGRNYDIRLGVDLRQPSVVRNLSNYLKQRRPAVAVMSPPCTCLKGWVGLNAKLHAKPQRAREQPAYFLETYVLS